MKSRTMRLDNYGCPIVARGGTKKVVCLNLKLLDWGEDGFATEAEIAALRTSFKQEVVVWHKLGHPNVAKFVCASMGTTDLKIPANNSNSGACTNLPARACCVVVEYLVGGTLKQYLIKNSRQKLAYKVMVQLALDLSRGY